MNLYSTCLASLVNGMVVKWSKPGGGSVFSPILSVNTGAAGASLAASPFGASPPSLAAFFGTSPSVDSLAWAGTVPCGFF